MNAKASLTVGRYCADLHIAPPERSYNYAKIERVPLCFVIYLPFACVSAIFWRDKQNHK